MDLSDEEVIILYSLFRNMQRLDMSVSDYTGCDSGNKTLIKLLYKVKRHVESGESEWMRGKGIRRWW